VLCSQSANAMQSNPMSTPNSISNVIQSDAIMECDAKLFIPIHFNGRYFSSQQSFDCRLSDLILME
jgi:hypothetical protein